MSGQLGTHSSSSPEPSDKTRTNCGQTAHARTRHHFGSPARTAAPYVRRASLTCIPTILLTLYLKLNLSSLSRADAGVAAVGAKAARARP
eukprot:3370520-Pleurochrysis_carterae.AAC.1